MEFLEKIDIRSWRNEVQCHLTKWLFFALGYALRSLRVQVSLPSSPKHLSIAAAIDPSVHSRPTNRESSILSPLRHGGKRRERWIPLEERKIGSFAPSTSHAYASITNHSRGKVNFFLGRRKSVSKDDDDQFYRPQFSILTANSVFASRFPVPKYERVCFRIAIVAGLNGKGWKKGSTLVNLNLFVGRKVFGLEI